MDVFFLNASAPEFIRVLVLRCCIHFNCLSCVLMVVWYGQTPAWTTTVDVVVVRGGRVGCQCLAVVRPAPCCSCVCARSSSGTLRLRVCSSVFEKPDRFGVRSFEMALFVAAARAFVLRDNRQHSSRNGRFRGGKREDPFTCPYARSCGESAGDCHTAAKPGNCAFSHQRRKCVLSTGPKCAVQLVGSPAQRLLWFVCAWAECHRDTVTPRTVTHGHRVLAEYGAVC